MTLTFRPTGRIPLDELHDYLTRNNLRIAGAGALGQVYLVSADSGLTREAIQAALAAQQGRGPSSSTLRARVQPDPPASAVPPPSTESARSDPPTGVPAQISLI